MILFTSPMSLKYVFKILKFKHTPKFIFEYFNKNIILKLVSPEDHSLAFVLYIIGLSLWDTELIISIPTPRHSSPYALLTENRILILLDDLLI